MNAVRNITMKRIILVVVIFMIGLTIRVTLAGTLAPETVLKSYKSGVRTCKQIEREYKNMEGQYDLMFKPWQEKSLPLLIEDKGLIALCQDTVLTFKHLSERMEGIDRKDLSFEEDHKDILAEYEGSRDKIEMIASRHKRLKEKHEDLFHEMMGH